MLEHVTPDMLLVLKSIAVGFVMCIPIGPVSIIIMRKTVGSGPRAALPAALGSITADMVYSAIAGFGIATIAQFFTLYQKYLQLLGIVILLFLAFKILRTKPNKLMKPVLTTTDVIADYTLGFFVVLFNPVVLFIMTNLLTTFHVQATVHTLEFGFLVTSGIAIGESIWWTAFISATHAATKRIGTQAPITINTFAGLLLLVLSTLFIIKIAVW